VRRALRCALTATILTVTITSLSGCALAAVAGASFNDQRAAAADAAVRSELANAQIAASSYAVENNGTYAGLSIKALESEGLTSRDVPAKFEIVVSFDGSSYCVQGTTKFAHTIHIGTTGSYTSGDCPAS
jgi:hypothetical protein